MEPGKIVPLLPGSRRAAAMRRACALAFMGLAACSGLSFAQAAGDLRNGTVKRVKLHGKTLEGNLEGDSPDRDVLVYLPASYKTSGNRRYPVVYFLHGFTDDPDHWWGFVKHFVNLPEILDRVFADGSAREMIVAMPNAYTPFQGSMYSKPATPGNWEDFVTGELVAYIDGHYRTIATSPGTNARRAEATAQVHIP
jgi:enterochelin esterase-like enzyme